MQDFGRILGGLVLGFLIISALVSAPVLLPRLLESSLTPETATGTSLERNFPTILTPAERFNADAPTRIEDLPGIVAKTSSTLALPASDERVLEQVRAQVRGLQIDRVNSSRWRIAETAPASRYASPGAICLAFYSRETGRTPLLETVTYARADSVTCLVPVTRNHP